MTMSTVPLPSLHGTGLGLTNLTFVPVPPSPSGAVEVFQETMYLAATFLDFGDCEYCLRIYALVLKIVRYIYTEV